MPAAAAAAVTVLRHSRHQGHLTSNIKKSFEDEVLQKVPDASQIQETGLMWKLCVGGHSNYQPRRAYLTREFLGLSTVGAKTLRDVIPIVDINGVNAKVKDDNDTVVTAVPEKHRVGSRLKKAHTIRNVEADPESPMAHMADRQDSEAEWDSVHTFLVSTDAKSSTGGRTYILQVLSQQELDKWISVLQRMSAEARQERDRREKSTVRRAREMLREWYESHLFQIFFGLLIGCNFVANVAEAQMVPDDDSATERTYRLLDIIFTSAFAVELAWNMFSHDFFQFWSDGWNIFDVVVVFFSVLSLAFEDLPLLSSLRLLRVFRAVRLFRKLTSLRIIFNAIIGSLFPVLNSVFIMVTITAMYAILAVELYGHRDEKFENFQQSMFSMYQVATGDSWASVIARDLLWIERGGQAPEFDRSVMVFFVTYSIVSSMVLLNVVVAVLLDNFTRCVSEEEAASAQVRASKYNKISDINVSCLDPVLEHLSYFEGKEHLREMSDSLFDSLDTEGSEQLGFHELKIGLEMLNVDPKIRFSPDEFEFMTVGGTLCDADGKLSRLHLFIIIQRLLELYTKRRLASVMAGEAEHDPSRKGLRLAAIKVLLSQNARMAQAAAAPAAPPHAAATSEPPAGGLRSAEDLDQFTAELPPQAAAARARGRDDVAQLDLSASHAAGVSGLAMPLSRVGANGGMHARQTRDAGTQTASVYVCF